MTNIDFHRQQSQTQFNHKSTYEFDSELDKESRNQDTERDSSGEEDSSSEFKFILDDTFHRKTHSNNRMLLTTGEGSGWEPEKVKGYLIGAQWFNPVSVNPHPILQQRLPQSKRMRFDIHIRYLGMMFDSMSTIVDVNTKSKTGSINQYRSLFRVLYCLFVDAMLLINGLRIFALFFVKDRLTRFYWGDMSIFWTKRPHFITVPIMFLFFSAFFTNLCFQFKQKDIQKRW